MLKLLAQLFVLLCTSLAQDVSFTNLLQLSVTPQYDVFWNVTGNRVTFIVVVATTGWVGFGISPNGLMLDSDVVMGLVNDNNAVVEFTVSEQDIMRFFMATYTPLLPRLTETAIYCLLPAIYTVPYIYIYICICILYYCTCVANYCTSLFAYTMGDKNIKLAHENIYTSNTRAFIHLEFPT